jgi:hypothetical protein
MMTAAECRDFAAWYRERANELGSSTQAHMMRNVARSLSGLATQLDMMSDYGRQSGQGGGHTLPVVVSSSNELAA